MTEIKTTYFQAMLDQLEDMVTLGLMDCEDAISLISNLIDTDEDEPTNESEAMIFDWIESLEA